MPRPGRGRHPTQRPKPKPHPTPRPRAPNPCPCPCGSTQAPTLLTSGARARVMGDWRRLSPTKPSNRLNQPLLVAKKVRQRSTQRTPSPRPPLQQPTLSRMHPSKPIAGIRTDSVGVREGDRAGIRSHKSVNNLSQKKGVEGHAKHTRQQPNGAAQTLWEDAAKCKRLDTNRAKQS